MCASYKKYKQRIDAEQTSPAKQNASKHSRRVE